MKNRFALFGASLVMLCVHTAVVADSSVRQIPIATQHITRAVATLSTSTTPDAPVALDVKAMGLLDAVQAKLQSLRDVTVD